MSLAANRFTLGGHCVIVPGAEQGERRGKVKRQVRLRTEIIVNLLLLMGAALFFVSLLLLKFAEEELLAQRVKAVTTALRTVAAALGSEVAADADQLAQRSRRLLGTFGEQEPRLAWTLVDTQLRPLAAGGASDAPPLVQDDLVRAGALAEAVLRLRYRTVLQPFGDNSSNLLRYSVPVPGRDGVQGVLQARLGLEDLAERLGAARRLTLSYVVLYGLVLVLFGGYLLGRTVVKPVRRLVTEVRGVAAGDLSRAALVEGPAEIAELASSFNAMTASLLASRQQTEATIASLHAANLELRKTQEALVRSEKLATVGHLAAGMAHELGNPLAAVLGYLELLQSDLPAGSQRDLAGYALKEIGRIDGLVRELLDYAAPSRGLAERFDPSAVLREALSLLQHQGRLCDHGVETSALPATLPSVQGVKAKLLQVFVNLLLNALDAGTAQQSLRLSAGVAEAELWLRVEDAGEGIAPEALAHIFDPFFTSKAPGRGRGLGLSVCQRVVADMGGRIEVESEVGKGSRFTVWLHRVEAVDGA